MIAPALVNEVNEIRTHFLEAVRLLRKTSSFASLLRDSERLPAEFGELLKIADSPRVQQPCQPTVTCAFIGSSGDGKTSIMAELFPDLAQEPRNWLQTDKTDTTSQALIIHYAPAGSPELEEVVVQSWDIPQITRLVKAATAENADARILARYFANHVEVDGTEAIFPEHDRKQFKFDLRQQLRPLPAPYRLSPAQRTDPRFIRALTVKEESSKIDPRPLLSINGQAFHVLHLRVVVQAIVLGDAFRQIASWAGRPAEEVAGLVFVDTPGLNVSGSIKDEVLRNALGKKNQQIVVELLRQDDLDLIVHLVLCGNQSAFARLWRAVREQCGPEELADLSERLVLAINGTNIYFTNPDLKRKWSDPAVAEREGDHLAITLEDNILKKMSEGGTVQPARICFVDSRRIVESAGTSYGDFYRQQQPFLHAWAQPGGVGYRTLERLRLLDAFPKNVEALCDPADRGQGFLVRQILELARAKGPSLFLRKHLRRCRLHGAIQELRKLLLRHYDAQGKLQRQVLAQVVRRWLQFLPPQDIRAIDTFARQHLDSEIDRLVLGPQAPVANARWVSEVFNETCRKLFWAVIRHAAAPKETQPLFEQYFRDQVNTWKSQWGYRSADLPSPTPRQPTPADLVGHCLKFHVREILYQLQQGDPEGETTATLMQDAQDQENVRQVLARLDQALGQANRLCQQYGVSIA